MRCSLCARELIERPDDQCTNIEHWKTYGDDNLKLFYEKCDELAGKEITLENIDAAADHCLKGDHDGGLVEAVDKIVRDRAALLDAINKFVDEHGFDVYWQTTLESVGECLDGYDPSVKEG